MSDQETSQPPAKARPPLFFANPYVLWLTVVVILLGGFLSFGSLPRLEDPRIVQRNAIILTAVPGASAERVEALVSEPIEQALDEIPEIKETISTSRSGFSSISIELIDAVDETNNTQIFAEIRDKLADAQRRFPAEALPPIFDDNRGAVAFTQILAITWPGESEGNLAVMTRSAEDLAQTLREVPGTELVRIYGAPEEEIAVIPDRAALALYGLTPDALTRAISASDSETPGGTIVGGANELPLEIAGDFADINSVAKASVLEAGGRRITIGDVAEVKRTVASPVESVGLTQGKRAVFIGVRMDAQTQVAGWTQAIDAQVGKFVAAGGGVSVEKAFDQSEYTTARLEELFGNLMLGIIVVVAVVTVLMGWRSAILVSSSIPLVGAATLFLVSVFGGQLHQMSVFGMIVALGILIDNAIVVVDESQRSLQEGIPREDVMQAVLKQLLVPLFASTLTTVIAFAPIVMLPGGTGDFVGWIAISVIIAITSAFGISVTIVAALAAKYAKATAADASWWERGVSGGRYTAGFTRLLHRAIERPLLGIAIGFAAPILGFLITPTLGSEFFPPTDREMFSIKATLPESASVEATRAFAERMETDLEAREGVVHVDWLIGGSFPSVYYNLVMNQDNAPNFAQAVITTESPAATQELVANLQQETPALYPEAQVLVAEFGQGPPASADVEIKVIGSSIGALQDAGEAIQRIMISHPSVVTTAITMPRGAPKLKVTANEDEAAAAGLRNADLSNQLRAAIDGQQAGTVREGLEELPVRVRYGYDLQSQLSGLEDFTFVSPSGAFLPLGAVGDVKMIPDTAAIMRIDGERANVVRGWVASDALAIDVAADIQQAIEAEGLMASDAYRIELGGQVEQSSDAQGALATYAPLLVTAMLATLILGFRSVILVVPLLFVAVGSVGNAFLATWLIAYPISFNTLIGTIGLIGLAFNNSIVVLAAIQADDRARQGDILAINEQVEKTGRHILSTTLTTVGAFLPLLLLVGGKFWPSLAIVLSGGVLGSMVLSQFFIPASYVLIAKWQSRKKREFGSNRVAALAASG
ncbi:MAG: efflux RND transporter permease subunit [Pseudomonadota bacterium]